LWESDLILGNNLAGQRVIEVASMSMGVVTRAMAKQQATEVDGDSVHIEGFAVEENVMNDKHSCGIERQLVDQTSIENQVSTD